MTNDLWDILQNNPSLQTDLDEDTIAVATSGSDSTKRISIRGGSFHKVVDGKEVSTVEDDYMKVIQQQPSMIIYMQHPYLLVGQLTLKYLIQKFLHLKLNYVICVNLV